MSGRVLVGYATAAGSTEGVARAVGETLESRGLAVDVQPVGEAPPPAGYDAVVLGSAIHGGQWLPEAVAYLEANRHALARVPVCMFCVHAMNAGQGAKETQRRLAYLDKERAIVRPASEAFFIGVGPMAEDTNAFSRWVFRRFGGVEGDGRDWAQIRAWAESLPV